MEHHVSAFSLPNEAISYILLNLSLKDLLNCSSVNKLFSELADQNFIWKHLFIKDHGGVVISHEGSWKDLYIQDSPLINLKNGRFIYRCLAKSVQMPNVNGDLERLYDFHGPFGVLNKTVNYRGSYSPSSTLSSSLFDLKTFQHKTIKGVKEAGKHHVKLVGKYWLLFEMENQTAPYSSGVSFRKIDVFKADLDLTKQPRIPATPVATLELEWETRTFVWGDFSGTCFAHHRSKRNEDYTTFEYTFVQFYDFAENATKIHEVKLPGDLLFFSDNYVGYTTGKLGHSFMVYNWRSKADLKTAAVTINVPNKHDITGVAEDNGKLLVHDQSGHLTVFDPQTGKVLNHYNISAPTKYEGGIVVRLVDYVCTLGLKKDRYMISHAVIDIRTGHVIQTLNFGEKYGRIEPLRNEVGKFSGKIFVNSNGDVGMIDLTSPFIHEHFNVLSIPGNADSIETAELGVDVHRVLYGKMWSDLAKLCGCPAFNLDSQILVEVKREYRYIVVFNSRQGTSKQNVILDKFFATCPLQHDDACPVQGLSLDADQPPLDKADFGYGNRGGRFKTSAKIWPASTLKGYGPAILFKEVWSENYGWVPSSMTKDFSLSELVQTVPQNADTDKEQMEQTILASLPVAIWKTIIRCVIDDYMSDFRRRSQLTTILKLIFRIKISSKIFNAVFNDEFMIDILTGRKYRALRKSYKKIRIRSMVAAGHFEQLVQFMKMPRFRNLKYFIDRTLNQQIDALLKRRSDLHFATESIKLFQPDTFELPTILSLIELAYKQCNQVLIYAWLKVSQFEIPSYNIARSNVRKIVSKIDEGKQMNFGSFYKLVELILIPYDEPELTERIKDLFREETKQIRQKSLIVPEGQLLNMTTLIQHKGFKRRKTNFCMQLKDKKDSVNKNMVLKYREKNGVTCEIEIETKSDQSDASTSLTYCYEGISTGNINELILRTSLNEKLFSSYLAHQTLPYIVPTKELLALPHDQQPWFLGIVTHQKRATIFTDHDTFVFCTYVRQNQLYFETNANQRGSLLIEEYEDVSKYLPRDKFVLGLNNGGQVIGLVEHLVRLAVNTGNFDKVKQIVKDYNLDLQTAKYLSYPDNMIKTYIQQHCTSKACPKYPINNDMLEWLIENGAPLPNELNATYYDNLFVNAEQVCDEQVLKSLADKGQSMTHVTLHKIVNRGVSYDTLKACYKNFRTKVYETTTMQEFLTCVNKGLYKSVTYGIRVLLMTAWKFDQHCLFRQLPKEIMKEILSYDGIDEPPFWDFISFMVENFQGPYTLTNHESIARIIPLVWAKWDHPSYSEFKRDIIDTLFNSNFFTMEQKVLEYFLKWSMKFLQRMEPMEKPKDNTYGLTQYCLATSNDMTQSLLKLITQKNITTSLLIMGIIYK